MTVDSSRTQAAAGNPSADFDVPLPAASELNRLSTGNYKLLTELLDARARNSDDLTPRLAQLLALEISERLQDSVDISSFTCSRRGANPLIDEILSFHSSMARNTGPYYSQDDLDALTIGFVGALLSPQNVSGLAELLARPVDNDPEDWQPESTVRSWTLGRPIKDMASALSSLGAGRGFFFSHGPSGLHPFSGPLEHDGVELLEIIRQDNPDKAHSGRYRVRATEGFCSEREGTTERSPGIFTRPPHAEPSFWAKHIRDALQSVATQTTAQLPPDAEIVLVTEGGVAKGTSTTYTDIDTVAYIRCNRTDVRAIASIVDSAFDDVFGELPFPITPGERLRLEFRLENPPQRLTLDAQGGMTAHDTALPWPPEFLIRSHESGILVTKAGSQDMRFKPEGSPTATVRIE